MRDIPSVACGGAPRGRCVCGESRHVLCWQLEASQRGETCGADVQPEGAGRSPTRTSKNTRSLPMQHTPGQDSADDRLLGGEGVLGVAAGVHERLGYLHGGAGLANGHGDGRVHRQPFHSAFRHTQPFDHQARRDGGAVDFGVCVLCPPPRETAVMVRVEVGEEVESARLGPLHEAVHHEGRPADKLVRGQRSASAALPARASAGPSAAATAAPAPAAHDEPFGCFRVVCRGSRLVASDHGGGRGLRHHALEHVGRLGLAPHSLCRIEHAGHYVSRRGPARTHDHRCRRVRRTGRRGCGRGSSSLDENRKRWQWHRTMGQVRSARALRDVEDAVVAVVPPEIAEAHHALRSPALDASQVHRSAVGHKRCHDGWAEGGQK
eukprot:scaffold204_cov113-Isochrysis_galbana.AAC.7